MYLVGKTEYREDMDWSLCVKKEISKQDLINTRYDDAFQIINLDTLQYFDPDKNAWVDIPKE